MTAELAVALPAVALSAAAVVAVGQAAVAELTCVDAARAAARAAARGDSPPRVRQVAREAAGGHAHVAVAASATGVVVRVRRRVRLVLPRGPAVTVRASASAVPEPADATPPDRGSATVLTTAVVMVSALLALGLAGVSSAVVARHRAASAADLAALAGASALTRSPGTSCEVARAVAQRNAAHLTWCREGARVVDVRVSVRPSGTAGALGEAVSRSRAGQPRQGWR